MAYSEAANAPAHPGPAVYGKGEAISFLLKSTEAELVLLPDINRDYKGLKWRALSAVEVASLASERTPGSILAAAQAIPDDERAPVLTIVLYTWLCLTRAIAVTWHREGRLTRREVAYLNLCCESVLQLLALLPGVLGTRHQTTFDQVEALQLVASVLPNVPPEIESMNLIPIPFPREAELVHVPLLALDVACSRLYRETKLKLPAMLEDQGLPAPFRARSVPDFGPRDIDGAQNGHADDAPAPIQASANAPPPPAAPAAPSAAPPASQPAPTDTPGQESALAGEQTSETVTGDGTPLVGDRIEHAAPAPVYSLKKDATGHWRLQCGCPPLTMDDSKGILYLRFLLEHQGQECPCEKVFVAGQPGDITAAAEVDCRTAADVAVDEVGEEVINGRLKDLEKERTDVALEPGGPAKDEKLQRIESEQISILEAARKNRNIKGQPRRLAPDKRQAVCAAIKRVVDALPDGPAKAHFKALRYGGKCAYMPGAHVPWEL